MRNIVVLMYCMPQRGHIVEPYHPFRSQEARQAYLTSYDKRARRWPVPSQTQMVDTSFGQTFIRIQGPADGPSLVLLPGDSENSLAWMPVIAMLSKTHRTFALDHIYDNGRSIYTQELSSPDDFVKWLDELFSALGLQQLCLMGYSYGGWQAALYALAHPDRLQKLVLLAPPATVLPPGLGMLARAIIYYFVPIHFVIKRYFYWYGPDSIRKDETRARVDEMIEEDLLARRCFTKRKFVPPSVLSDDDWGKLKVPTLFLVGEHEMNYPAQCAVERLQEVAPNVEAKIAPDTDHYLSLNPDWIARNSLNFLNR